MWEYDWSKYYTFLKIVWNVVIKVTHRKNKKGE